MKLLRKAVELGKNDKYYYRVLADGLALQGRTTYNPKEAERYYKRALSMETDYAAAYHGLAWLYAGERRFAEAKQALNKYKSLVPARVANSYGNRLLEKRINQQ